MTTLGVCGALKAGGPCPGQIIVIEQVGSLLEGECDLCGTPAAMPTIRADSDHRRELRLERAGIPEAFRDKRFDENQGNQYALDVALSWLEHVAAEPVPAPAFYGEVGRGKTHLLSSLACRLINEHDKAVLFVSARGLLRRLQRFDTEAQALWQRAKTINVLALDDVGAQQITDWRHDQLGELVDERYERALPIVLATNWVPAQWGDVMDERTASRLRGMTVPVQLRGVDRRSAVEA